MKNKFISILIAFSLLIGLTATASAASVYTHGGKWSYGVGSKYVWSYYYHGNKGIVQQLLESTNHIVVILDQVNNLKHRQLKHGLEMRLIIIYINNFRE